MSSELLNTAQTQRIERPEFLVQQLSEQVRWQSEQLVERDAENAEI